jgi:cell division initiation protein
MDLTARDIHEKEFHDAWRGYNQEEVDDFLDRIAEVLDRIQHENQTLQARVKELDQAVSASRDTEEMLKKTLVSAQQAAEEAIATAKAKASDLITEAEERARRSIEEATERVQTAEAEARRKTLEAEREHQVRRAELDANIARLQALENELKGRIKGFLDQQAEALQGLEIAGPPPDIRGPRAARTETAGEAGDADGAQEGEAGAGDPGATAASESSGSPEANGAPAGANASADAAAGSQRVVTLPPDASSNGSDDPAPAEAGHARRGVRGLFGRDEG